MAARLQLLSGSLNSSRLCVRTLQATQRTYATAEPAPVVKSPLRRRKGGDLGSHLPKHVIPPDAYIPAYPHGDFALFKTANNGLYGGQMILFGNNVSDKTQTKTRRSWKPNVLDKSLYSVALKKRIKLRITSNVLKTVDREGGLDKYLLKDNERRLKELGPLGWALRWALMQKPEVRESMRAEAAALGVDQATIDAQWPTQQMLAEQRTPASGLVQASDMIPQVYDDVEEAEEDIEEEGEETGQVERLKNLTKDEKRLANDAIMEYARAVKAAQRYLARDKVDSEEAGMKLAFLRERERGEFTQSKKQKFDDMLKEQFSDNDVLDTRTRFDLPPTLSDTKVRKIAFLQQRRQEIEEAGSYEAWREERARRHAQSSTEDGRQVSTQNDTKEVYTALIAEAENASTNEDLPHGRKHFFLRAMAKAEMAIRAKSAGGKDEYANMRIAEQRRSTSSKYKAWFFWRRPMTQHGVGSNA